MTIKQSPKFLVMVFVVMFAVIGASSKWLSGVRFDLTENALYTLSDGTHNILSELDQPVTIDFYFSEKATTQLPALRTYAQRVDELLQEYSTIAGDMVIVNKVDPEPFSEEEDQAALAGLQGVPGGARGDEVYFGLVAKNEAGAQEIIPFIQPDKEAFLEYDLTRMISALSTEARPRLGIYSGIEINGGFDYMTRQERPEWAVLQYIESSFEIEWIDSKASSLDGIDVLLLVAPQNLSNELLFAIDQFVLGGGRTMVFLDPYSEALAGSSGMPSVQRADIPELLASWGVALRKDVFLKDYDNSMVVGVGAERTPVRHLGLLGLTAESMSGDDIVVFGLESVNWSTAGILDVVAGSTTTVTPLIQSSDQSQPHIVEDLLELHDPQTLMKDFAPTGERYTLAARIAGKATTAFPDGVEIEVPVENKTEGNVEEGEAEVRTERLVPALKASENIQLLIVSDSDVLSDRLWVQVQNFFGQQVVTPWADNASFLMNSLETMSGHPDLVEIRSQGRFNRPFTRVDTLRRMAEERFYAEQELLEEELSSLEGKLMELEQIRGDGEGALFSPEQEAELVNFQEEKLKIRKKLREVQHQLDQDIEALGSQLKLINILLIPAMICFFVLLAAARRRFR